MKYIPLILFLSIVFLISCTESKELPIYGHKEIIGQDTINHTIRDFSFLNQDSVLMTNEDLSDYIYVSDFFFISCPSICPKVKKQMLRIYDKFKNDSKLKLVSHTMDPKRDTPEALKLYSKNLEVDNDKWIFLTGDKYELSDIADDYFTVVIEDPDAPGGFDHSGKLILIDTNRHVRAFCEGTDPDDVTEFLKDIQNLLDEYKS